MRISTVAMLVAQLPRYSLTPTLQGYTTPALRIERDHWGGWVKLEDVDAILVLLAKLDREEAGCVR